MTHVTYILTNYLTNPLTDIIWNIVKLFERMRETMFKEKNTYHVAEMLQKLEYRQHSVSDVYEAIQSGSLEKLR